MLHTHVAVVLLCSNCCAMACCAAEAVAVKYFVVLLLYTCSVCYCCAVLDAISFPRPLYPWVSLLSLLVRYSVYGSLFWLCPCTSLLSLVARLSLLQKERETDREKDRHRQTDKQTNRDRERKHSGTADRHMNKERHTRVYSGEKTRGIHWYKSTKTRKNQNHTLQRQRRSRVQT